jgi:hypothetical protein
VHSTLFGSDGRASRWTRWKPSRPPIATNVPGAILSNGHKIDPTALTQNAQDALSRAACAAAEFRLQAGEDQLTGGSDEFIYGENLNVLRRADRAAEKIAAELAGSGLITFSGTITGGWCVSFLM